MTEVVAMALARAVKASVWLCDRCEGKETGIFVLAEYPRDVADGSSNGKRGQAERSSKCSESCVTSSAS